MANTSIYDFCKKKNLPERPSPPLERVSFIYHLVQFKKDQIKIQALQDPSRKINIIPLVYTAKLGFKNQPTDVKAQKINGFIFKLFAMVLISF